MADDSEIRAVRFRSAECTLYEAVLIRVLSDACGRGLALSRGHHEYYRDQARESLLSGRSDFQMVCVLAGLEPEAVLAGVRRLATSG